MEIVGEDVLGDLLRHSEIETIAAPAGRQIHRAEHLAAGMDLHRALFRSSVEKFTDKSNRLEDLERTGMHHRRAVPMERPKQRVDQMARHTASLKLRGKQQPRRPRTYDEHRSRTVSRIRHVAPPTLKPTIPKSS